MYFFKQKTAYEMRISDLSPDVCSSDLYSQTRSLIPPLKGWLAWTDSLVARLGSAGRLQCVDVDADGDRADHLTGRRVDDRHGYLRLEGLRGLIHLDLVDEDGIGTALVGFLPLGFIALPVVGGDIDRKSTRLNSGH